MTYAECVVGVIAFILGDFLGYFMSLMVQRHVRQEMQGGFGISEGEKPKADSDYDWSKTFDEVCDCVASKLQNPPHIVVTHRGKRR